MEIVWDIFEFEESLIHNIKRNIIVEYNEN